MKVYTTFFIYKKKKNTTFFIGTITNIEPRRNAVDTLIIYLIVILIIN